MKYYKIILSVLMVVSYYNLQAQDRFYTKSGQIIFFSKAPLESIEAGNKNVTCVLDTKTGQLQFVVLMKGFEFKKALMQEHFNENYLESDKFPKSVFKGSIDNISKIDFNKEGKYTVTITGQLTVHGETKTITAPAVFTIQKENVLAAAEFLINLADYKIQIPALVKDKISKTIKVAVNLKYDAVSIPAKNS